MAIFQLGTMIGQYEIASLPVQGGMGVVYFCLDHRNNKKPVAIKTFKPEFLLDYEARDRFLREATAWVNLGRHQNIVQCYAVDYIEPMDFLVLELIVKERGVEDASLRSWIRSPMKEEQALLFAIQIARGLQYADLKIPNFVHRDLKPENILIGADKLPNTNISRLRVTDFGLATIQKGGSAESMEDNEKIVSRTLLSRGIVGTPLYMAPEQWKGNDVGVYTDVYALGCILYEMLTAKRIVDGQSVSDLRSAHCDGRLKSAPEGISHELSAILRRCLSLQPSERYQEWQEVTRRLEQAYIGLVGSAAPSEAIIAESTQEEKLQDGWSYNAMGLTYKLIGKADVAKDYFEKSLSIAHEVGNRKGEAAALGNLGGIFQTLGDVQLAIGYHEQSLSIECEVGNKLGVAQSLSSLGEAYHELGELQRAIKYHEQSLAIYREIGDTRGEGTVLGSLGLTYVRLGDVQRAINYYEQSLAICREIGDMRGEGHVLGNLGVAYKHLGDVHRAIKCHEQSLSIKLITGDKRGEGVSLGNLGSAYHQLGEVRRAIGYYEQSLAIAHETGDQRAEGAVLGNLGNAYENLGEVKRAIEYYEQAIALRREIGDRYGVATDLFNLALLYGKQTDITHGFPIAQESAQIFAEIGSPNAQRAQQLVDIMEPLARLFNKK
jgi:serine/threonine protein kinase